MAPLFDKATALLQLVSLFSVFSASASAQSTTTNAFPAQFTLPTDIDNGANVLPNIYDSNATDAQTACPGYTASGVERTDYGFTAQLNLAGSPCNVYGNDVQTLNLTVEYQSDSRLSINIHPAYLDSSNQSYYLLPGYSVPKPAVEPNAAHTVPKNDLGFFWTNSPSFGFSVIRQSTGDVLFSSVGSKLVYEDQFIEFVTALPENYNLYGLPETIHEFRLGNNLTRTLYAADVGDVVDANLYGVHPFYVDTRYYEVESDTGNLTLVTSNTTNSSAEYVSTSHLVYNRNIHGQDILLRDRNVTWRTLGGSIDLYFFSGPTAAEATQQYQQAAAGLPAMQQYWTFGFHQCRWGYENWTVMQEVVDGYKAVGIPLETVWNDIDYMKEYRDFDNDPIRFNYSEAQGFFERLSSNGQHYVPIVDSAIYKPNPKNASDAYEIYNRGEAAGAFMKNPDGSEYVGSVWPGLTVFPDWLEGSGAGQWWIDEMKTWYDSVPGGTYFSGIWIDMSEVSSFCVGSCGSNTTLQDMNPVHPPFSLPGEIYDVIYDYPEGFNLTNSTEAAAAASASASQSAASASHYGTASSTAPYLRTTPTPGNRNVNHPPYVINNNAGDLAVHAVSPNATHHDGTLEYDAHSLFGLGILNATYHALLNIFPNQRPFIIGRSTTVGSGRVAGHWGGDNYSKFYYMYAAIPQALQFSLAGIPMFGTDTCGFAGNSDYELCSRWMQLSAFFPFYRNHNTLSADPQEAYRWESVADATKAAMQIRFNLLPYMYTLFYHAATTGSTVMRALAWEVPSDPSLAAADRQFFLGPAILVTPVLDPNVSSVNGVFPGAGKGGEIYYDWYTQTRAEQASNVSIPAPLGHIPVFIRGGHILPMQQQAMVTRDARQTPWSVLVALNQQGKASGGLYLDDGVSLNPNETMYVNLAASKGRLWACARGTYGDKNALANVTVLGVQSEPKSVRLNGADVGASVRYNGTSQVLVVDGLRNATARGVWSRDWVLEWS